jgi:hypothetical protein
VDEELQVAGLPATIGGSNLLVQVGEDVLQVSVGLGEDGPADPRFRPLATGIAELAVAVAPAAVAALATPEPEPTPEPAPEISLCTALPLDELNAFSGLGLDEATDGGPTTCTYAALDGDPGFHVVNAFIATGGLGLYAMAFPESEEASIAGLPAIVGDQGIAGAYRVVVGLPDGDRVLDVSVFLDSSVDAPATSAADTARFAAERIAEFAADQ